MTEDWKDLKEAEDFTYFRAELLEMSPESYSRKKKADSRRHMQDVLRHQNRMREDFARLDEVSQTKLLDSLGASGYRDRDWWYRMLMDGPKHRDKPTA